MNGGVQLGREYGVRVVSLSEWPNSIPGGRKMKDGGRVPQASWQLNAFLPPTGGQKEMCLKLAL